MKQATVLHQVQGRDSRSLQHHNITVEYETNEEGFSA